MAGCLPALAAVALLGAAAAGCRSEAVKVELREQAITGSAGLRVVNGSDLVTRVFFDGAYIGEVDRDTTRQWNVPAGAHVVKMNTAGVKANPLITTYEFTGGQIWALTVTWKDITPAP